MKLRAGTQQYYCCRACQAMASIGNDEWKDPSTVLCWGVECLIFSCLGLFCVNYLCAKYLVFCAHIYIYIYMYTHTFSKHTSCYVFNKTRPTKKSQDWLSQDFILEASMLHKTTDNLSNTTLQHNPATTKWPPTREELQSLSFQNFFGLSTRCF